MVGISASVTLAAFMTLAAFPITLKGNVAEATGLASNTELTMTSTGNSASLNLMPKDANGTFAYSSDSELAKFAITTNNYTGYTLSIKGSDDTRRLTNTATSTALDSITSIVSESTFNTAAYNGKWGYRPSRYNSTDNVGFLEAPNTIASTLDVTNSANSTANNYSIGLGARVDYSKPAGTYTNTFILTAVANPVAYTLNYADITSDASLSNMPSTDSGTVASTNVAISTSVPTRTGYTFAGWCDMEPTSSADGSVSCPTGGTVYPASTVAAPSYYSFVNQTVASTTGTLYATWDINQYTCTKQYRLQNADGTWGNYTTDTTEQVNYGATCSYSKTVTNYKGSDSGANNSAASTSGTMTTSGLTLQVSMYRNTYSVSLTRGTGIASVSITGTGLKSGSGTASAVARYGGAITIAATLTSGYEWVNWTGSATYTNRSQSISSVTSNLSFTANGKSSKIYFQNATMSNCGSNMYDNRGSDAYKNIAYTTAKIGNLCYMTRNLDLPGGTTLTSADSNVTSSYTLPTSSISNFGYNNRGAVYNSNSTTCASANPCYSYYNYLTATAGTNPSSGAATSDICPKGWRLPTKSEYITLTNIYTTAAALTSSPFLGVKAGYYYDNSSLSAGGSQGNLWTSTPADNNSMQAYDLVFSNYIVESSYTSNKGSGYSVRCVKS